MKLRMNFSFPFAAMVPWLTGLAWGVALLGLVLVGLMAVSALRLSHENPRLEETLTAIRKNPVVYPSPGSLPSEGDLTDLRRGLKGINSLGVGGGKSLSSILSRLEILLPAGARLLSFQRDDQTGELQVVVEAASIDQLSGFLASLESDQDFSKVTLTKQSQAQDGKSNGVQFSLDLVENRA